MTEENQDTDLAKEVRSLRTEVGKLNNHRYIKLHDSVVKLGLFQLYRGLAFGLGSVLGATILVSVAAFLLSKIDFIPIIGDWATDIAKEIDADNAESYGVDGEADGNAAASGDETDDEEAAAENPSPGGQPVDETGAEPVDRSDFGITDDTPAGETGESQ